MLAYTIKSVIFLSMMYIPYMLMLRKESFFHFNRILLISIMLLSLILPLCDFHSLSIENNPIQHGMLVVGAPTTIFVEGAENVATTEGINWFVLAFYIYIIGMVATFIWKFVQLVALYGTIRNCVLWKDKQDGITIYCHVQDIAPFSWLNTIVISENDYNNNATEILRHELGHIQHRHSFDIILVNIVQTIQWWNPLAWILAASLRDVHEYEADHVVLTSGVNIRQYQTLLIRKAVANTNYTFANSFNHSLLKKRITMMVKEKSNPWMRTKALYLIPVAAIVLCAFATPELNRQVNKITAKVNEAEKESLKHLPIPIRPKENLEEKKVYEVSRVIDVPLSEDNIYIYGHITSGNEMDELPRFPGGNTAWDNFIKNNLKYPKEAKDQGLQGYVLYSFVVERDGGITHPKIVRGIDPLLDKEVIRMVNSMPKWIPGKRNGRLDVRTQFTCSVSFGED